MLLLTRFFLLSFVLWFPTAALERPGVEYRIFQFPANQIPQIDGKPNDWAMVPASYAIGMDQLKETVRGRGFQTDLKDLDVMVKVGWVKGLNRLYFLYEASDNYWDFRRGDIHNDIFELVVDGDLSGGPLIAAMHPQPGIDKMEAFFSFQGVHAQNYHIFTPAPDRDWAFVWGCQPWIKELPYANAAYDYNFKHGEAGKLTLEFWITPFDYAPYEGPGRAVESKLIENKIIGMSWAVLDYDDENAATYNGFWNLSHKTTMYGNASDLVAFRLMPLEPPWRKPLQAQWSFQVLDMDSRLVAFQDRSIGEVTRRHWDFGDGESSTDPFPNHRYKSGGEYVVSLEVEGPAGKSRWVKVRDVVVR
ncbi:MAG TPA: PKD domain-containing protein [Bryobacteraceae bacterium]|nr:PKD domain-containing protein [Bryobacteraceae bacterium]